MEEFPKTLRNIPLFKEITEKDLNRIARVVKKKMYPLGSFLFQSGAPRNEMFIIQRGEVEILETLGDIRKIVARLGEGNFVGEGAILDDDPHSTSCKAVVDTDVLVLKREEIDAILQASPETAQKILSQVARIITYRLKYTSFGYRGAAISAKAGGRYRIEHDLLGERSVPADAYFGIQTLRALENYNITGITLAHFPNLIKALAMVKKAAARANQKLGDLPKDIAEAICAACDEVIAGNLHTQFVVDMIQGGAGTSTNMNANEVIANRALEIMGKTRGEYQLIHPNNHVNKSQSTNDVYPTAIRLAIQLSYRDLTEAMSELAYELKQKPVEFSDIIKDEKLLDEQQLKDVLTPEKMTRPRI